MTRKRDGSGQGNPKTSKKNQELKANNAAKTEASISHYQMLAYIQKDESKPRPKSLRLPPLDIFVWVVPDNT